MRILGCSGVAVFDEPSLQLTRVRIAMVSVFSANAVHDLQPVPISDPPVRPCIHKSKTCLVGSCAEDSRTIGLHGNEQVARTRVLTRTSKRNASGTELCAVGLVSQRLTRPYLLSIWAQGVIPLTLLRGVCGNSKLDEEARKDTIKQHVCEMTILNEVNKSIDAIRRQRSIQGYVERASGCFELDLVLLGLHGRLWKPS